jgi:hypothetical protein
VLLFARIVRVGVDERLADAGFLFLTREPKPRMEWSVMAMTIVTFTAVSCCICCRFRVERL